MKICLYLFAMVTLVGSASGSEADSLDLDSALVDSSQIDTLEVILITPCDDCPTVDSSQTVSANQTAWAAERLREYQQAVKDSAVPWLPISFHDSLAAYLLSERLNQRRWLKMAWYHDAGDYFRSDPAYLVTDYQSTPMRKTVQPFGLSGDRMNVITNAFSIRPFDHPLEPDGMFDFNDFPTALDNDVYLLPGPTGMLFGGERAVASLITRPHRETGYDPLIRFKVDKGNYAYSYARASYNKSFRSGRQIDMSIGYRKADGIGFNRYEDAYHYYGDFLSPLGGPYSVRLAGRLYDRGSPLILRPDNNGQAAIRDRVDRELKVTVNRLDPSQTKQTAVSFTHLHQASRWSSRYLANYSYTGNGGEVSRQWATGESLWDLSAGGDYLTYAPESLRYYRTSGHLSLGLLKRGGKNIFSGRVAVVYDKDFKMLPSAVIMTTRESDNWFWTASVGYTERAPTLHELFKPYRMAQMYSNTTVDYADRGNPGLVSEKELVGNLMIEIGDTLSSARLSLTAGKIIDGINYRASQTINITEYSPSNADITFASISTNERLQFGEYISLLGGGSYNYQKHNDIDIVPYAPRYQLFGGGELNVYWRQRALHFFAYGEVVYAGPYEGYYDTDLGRTAVLNAKLSFQMRSFRFFYVYQNPINIVDLPRDQFYGSGRYVYYGFTWDFLN